ncbi:Uncharacterized protein APZ42_003239, partial [Daphnia magna]
FAQQPRPPGQSDQRRARHQPDRRSSHRRIEFRPAPGFVRGAVAGPGDLACLSVSGFGTVGGLDQSASGRFAAGPGLEGLARG